MAIAFFAVLPVICYKAAHYGYKDDKQLVNP